jgi:4'-phosphopantetheinyl transferase
LFYDICRFRQCDMCQQGSPDIIPQITMKIGKSAWTKLGPEYELPKDEVHVWRASLNSGASSFDKLGQFLSPAEQIHADRFRFEIDRRRSIVGRGYLRLLLGRILGAPPETIELVCDEFGKPCLSESSTALQFNLSHSGNAILIAIARNREVGIDVEKIRTDLALDEIAARFFSANECKTLFSLAGPARHLAFFTCWTRKEAYVKARGVGLSMPLDRFDVSFLTNERPRLLVTRDDPLEAERWRLAALDLSPEYVATLAAAGMHWTLKCWDLDSEAH